jgi:diguanylate cyclase (GGDEF)-like protein
MLGPQLTAIGVDAATGLPNRSTFLDTLREIIAERRHRHVELSLMLVAIDDLMQLHDQYGAVAGEALLRVITQLIRSTTRATFDRLGLYTNDTIGVLLVDASLDEAQRGAERLKRALANCRLRDDGRDLSVRATIGVAELQSGGDSHTLLASAEQALGTARNQESLTGQTDRSPSQLAST